VDGTWSESESESESEEEEDENSEEEEEEKVTREEEEEKVTREEEEEEKEPSYEVDASEMLDKETSEYFAAHFDEFNERFFESNYNRVALHNLDPYVRRQVHEQADTYKLYHWTENGKNMFDYNHK
jgi:hypothetical protein